MDEGSFESQEPINISDFKKAESPQGNKSQKPANLAEFRNTKIQESEFSPKDISSLNSQEYEAYLWDLVKNPSPENILPQISRIIDRLGEETDSIDLGNDEAVIAANNIGQPTSEFLWRLASTPTTTRIEKEDIEKMLAYITDPNELKRGYVLSCIDPLRALDARNGDETVGVLTKLAEKINQDIALKNKTKITFPSELLIQANEHMFLGDVLVRSLEVAQNDEALGEIFVDYANVMGFNEVRRTMLNYSQGNDDFLEILKRTEKITGLQINEGTEIHSDNNKFYQNMDKEGYQAYNDLTNSEVDMLVKMTEPDEIGLDVAAGTGRHLIPFSKLGRNVSGIDASELDVANVIKAHPDIKYEIGVWNKINRDDESVNFIYSLGRSPLHNSSIAQWLNMLEEFNRILISPESSKKSGRVILDLPELSSKHYASHMEELKKKLNSIGIWNVSEGSMIDTPDGRNYVDRLAPSPKQLEAMAKLKGFNARQFASGEFHDENGDIVTNHYWELTKTNIKLSPEEEAQAIKDAYGINQQTETQSQRSAA